MKKIKKIFKITFFLVCLYLALNIIPVLSFKKYINKAPLPHNYIKGGYHIHSVFSDGNGDIDDISVAAKMADWNFLILTDHGNPNIKSTQSSTWKNNILIVGATEISLNEGHLTAIGYNPKNNFKYPPDASSTIRDINAEGGSTFISHPFEKKIPWKDWNLEGFTGIELFSIYSSAKSKGLKLLLNFPVQYLFNQEFALLNILKYPNQNIKQWDKINLTGKYFGIFALDAHAKLKLTDSTKLNYPDYPALFKIFSLYIKIDQPLKKSPQRSINIINKSIKNGNFFNTIEALAPANGFDFFYLTKTKQTIPMGQTTEETEGVLKFNLPFNFANSLKIYRNGSLFKEIKHNFQKNLEIDINEPGNYRAEIYITNSKFKNLPWIITNPIFIDHGNSNKNIQISNNINHLKNKDISMELINNLSIEKNPSSRGFFSQSFDSEKMPNANLKFHLIKENNKKDFWVALANRKANDFSGFSGISFFANSKKKMRFWFEIKTEDDDNKKWYRYSFLAGPKWEETYLRFSQFYNIHGEKQPMNLGHITSLFFSINNGISYKNISGELTIKNIRLIY